MQHVKGIILIQIRSMFFTSLNFKREDRGVVSKVPVLYNGKGPRVLIFSFKKREVKRFNL